MGRRAAWHSAPLRTTLTGALTLAAALAAAALAAALTGTLTLAMALAMPVGGTVAIGVRFIGVVGSRCRRRTGRWGGRSWLLLARLSPWPLAPSLLGDAGLELGIGLRDA